jgi:hypothetical protein
VRFLGGLADLCSDPPIGSTGNADLPQLMETDNCVRKLTAPDAGFSIEDPSPWASSVWTLAFQSNDGGRSENDHRSVSFHVGRQRHS